MTKGICEICGRTAKTSMGEGKEFCPDHSLADMPKGEAPTKYQSEVLGKSSQTDKTYSDKDKDKEYT